MWQPNLHKYVMKCLLRIWIRLHNIGVWVHQMYVFIFQKFNNLCARCYETSLLLLKREWLTTFWSFVNLLWQFSSISQWYFRVSIERKLIFLKILFLKIIYLVFLTKKKSVEYKYVYVLFLKGKFIFLPCVIPASRNYTLNAIPTISKVEVKYILYN